MSSSPAPSEPRPSKAADHVSAPLVLWIVGAATLAFTAAAVAPEGWRRVVTFALAVLAGVLGPIASSRTRSGLKAGGFVLTLLLFLSAGTVSIWPSAGNGVVAALPSLPPSTATTASGDSGGPSSNATGRSDAGQSLFDYVVAPETDAPEYCELFALPEDEPSSQEGALTAEQVYRAGGATDTEVEGQTTGNFSLSVQGTTSRAVIIHDITIGAVQTKDPRTIKSLVDTCPVGGGATGFRRLWIFPESGRTELREPDVGALPDEPSRFPLQVSESDPEIFEIHVECEKKCLAEFVVEIHWSSGTQSGVQEVVRDFGEPFRVFAGDATLPITRTGS